MPTTSHITHSLFTRATHSSPLLLTPFSSAVLRAGVFNLSVVKARLVFTHMGLPVAALAAALLTALLDVLLATQLMPSSAAVVPGLRTETREDIECNAQCCQLGSSSLFFCSSFTTRNY